MNLDAAELSKILGRLANTEKPQTSADENTFGRLNLNTGEANKKSDVNTNGLNNIGGGVNGQNNGGSFNGNNNQRGFNGDSNGQGNEVKTNIEIPSAEIPDARILDVKIQPVVVIQDLLTQGGQLNKNSVTEKPKKLTIKQR